MITIVSNFKCLGSSTIAICALIGLLLATGINNADTIHVDITASEVEDGSPSNPYHTLKKAVDEATSGDTLVVKSDLYPEGPVINKKLTITASGGPVIVGQYIRLRVLTHNVFGKNERFCENRAVVFGERIAEYFRFAGPPFDIIGLQEYFDGFFNSCDSNYLSQAIWSTGGYRLDHNYYRFYPEGEWVEGQRDGGVGIFTLHRIIEFKEWEWDGNRRPFWDGVVHGFIFARTKILSTPLTIDTYVVHLYDGASASYRRSMLRQLAYRIGQFSKDSGNPVIIMGDFNIEDSNEGYEDIIDILGDPIDPWLESHATDPGYTFDCEENTVLLDCNSQKRLDYIFIATDSRLTDHPYNVVIDPTEVRLVKWRVTEPIGLHVSDHFGVEATIKFLLR